jgi:microcystin-dependent protein
VDALLGSILLFAGSSWIPKGWALCDGQTLPIEDNQALFSVIGTTYGGDGVTNFALPNIAALSEDGPRYIICLVGIFPSPPD